MKVGGVPLGQDQYPGELIFREVSGDVVPTRSILTAGFIVLDAGTLGAFIGNMLSICLLGIWGILLCT